MCYQMGLLFPEREGEVVSVQKRDGMKQCWSGYAAAEVALQLHDTESLGRYSRVQSAD